MGKWVKAKMLQVPCKFTVLATQICDFSPEWPQIAFKMRDSSPKMQQMGRKTAPETEKQK